MESIQNFLRVPKPDQKKWDFKNRRQELVQKFVDQINIGRTKTNYPPVTAKRLSSQYLWTMDTWELEVFFKECDQSTNFGKRFFGSFKKK
jgi:hypothetical protein